MLGVPLTCFHLSIYLLAGKCQASSHLSITLFTTTEQDTVEQAEDLWPATYIGLWV